MKNIIFLSLILVLNSCALAFNKKTTKVKFNSFPSGAEVRVNGEYIGSTPVSADLWGGPRSHIDIVYSKKGYANREFRIYSKYRPNWACQLDALGTLFFLVPGASLVTKKCQTFDQSVFKAIDKGNRQNVLIQDSY